MQLLDTAMNELDHLRCEMSVVFKSNLLEVLGSALMNRWWKWKSAAKESDRRTTQTQQGKLHNVSGENKIFKSSLTIINYFYVDNETLLLSNQNVIGTN